MNWTDQQRQAIETEGNLIVSAAAGSGKTAVLTERIAQRILSGTPVDRMLILTFTRAAASEMRQRIEKRLRALSEETAAPETEAYLRAQLEALGAADISTIDSFCVRVLRRHGYRLGIAANVRVADDIELAVIRQETKDRILTAFGENDDEDYKTVLRLYRSEDAVFEAIESVRSFLDARPDPDGWLLERAGCEEKSFAAAEALLLDRMKLQLGGAFAELTAERDMLSPALGKVIAMLDDEGMQVRAVLSQDTYDGYRSGLRSLSFETMRFPKGTEPSDKEKIQKARNALKAAVNAQRAETEREEAEERRLDIKSRVFSDALLSATKKYSDEYTLAKQRRGVVDFADTEHFALELLKDPRVAEEYRERFLYIAVDEYQDSNALQEALLDAIRQPDNLFLVGDIKQSVYRFRQAEPGLFLEKLKKWNGTAEGNRIDLNRNFRSAPDILTAVNTVFEKIMTEQTGEIDYDARARLYPGSQRTTGGMEFCLIDKDAEAPAYEPFQSEENDAQDALEDVRDAEAEARYTAKRIVEMMDAGMTVTENDAERPVRYSDFAVLLRTKKEAQTFAETLAVCGIPNYVQASGGYFDALEVMVVLNCLRVIDNGRQDIPLLSVLRSPLFRYTSEELAAIRAAYPDGPFHEAFRAAAEAEEARAAGETDENASETEAPAETASKVPAENGPALPEISLPGEDSKRRTAAFRKKVLDTAAWLKKMRFESEIQTVSGLLSEIIDETGYYEQVGAEPAGSQRQRNLDALLERARQFEASGARGVWAFIRTMDSASENAAIGAAPEGAGNVCRIMTVHKSKGLEFPVVFLAQAGRSFSKAQRAQYVLRDADLGIGMRVIDEGVLKETLRFRAIREKNALNEIAEEMRVLYVALTRAKQKMIAIAAVRHPRELAAASKKPMQAFSVLSAQSAVPWLLAGQDGMSVRIVPRAEAAAARPRQAAEGPSAESAAMTREQLKTLFEWKYPYRDAVALPAKESVSRAAGRLVRADSVQIPDFRRPSFAEKDVGASAAIRGTVMHQLLKRLPLRALNGADVEEELRMMREQSVMEEEETEAVRTEDVVWLTGTPLWARAAASGYLRREWNFTLNMPASELFDTASKEPVLLQGVIDLCFREDGKWILADYKTDRLLPGEDPKQHAERHRPQLSLYANALEKLTGTEVGEILVVLLSAHETVRLS